MSRDELESKMLMLLAQRDMHAWRRHVRDVQQANLGCDDEQSKRSPCPYHEEHNQPRESDWMDEPYQIGR
jgi:hypothetical protein